MSNKNVCVFLDRDGVINSISSGFVDRASNFEFISKSPNAIKILNDKNFKVVVVTNQGGIQSGYLTEDDLKEIHNFMIEQLKKFGAKVDKIYYAKTNDKNDPMRKPNTGMLEQAVQDLKLNKYKFYMVGDSLTDIEAGNSFNATTLLVKTGMGYDEQKKIKSLKHSPDYVTQNLYTAVLKILNLEKL